MLTLAGVVDPRGKRLPVGDGDENGVVQWFALGEFVQLAIAIVSCLRQKEGWIV